MSGELAGLTPASLKLAVENLPRRALQSLAKKQGVKVRQPAPARVRRACKAP